MDVPQWVREMRGPVAEEHGIRMAGQYAEKEAAAILRVDYTTLKRWRRAGKIAPVRYGDGVRYLGIHLIDFIIAGTESVQWHATQNGNSKSVATG